MSPAKKKLTDAQLQTYLDQALSISEMEAMEEALRHSAPARRSLEDSRRLRQALKSSRPEVPSKAMWKNIQGRLAQ